MEVVATARPPTISAAQRTELRSTGCLAIPGALSEAEVERVTAALDRVWGQESVAANGDGPCAMHLLDGIGRDDEFIDLVDHPAVLPVIWGELGWNIHVYHSHLDVNPPRTEPRAGPVWGWHQDGGRQNLELDGEPRPRLSLKVAFWLSDLSKPGRGNMLVIPGSHSRNTLARPAPGAAFADPPGARPILASPGDALVFDRRLWHSRSDNLSNLARKAVFVAYTFRWIRPRDSLGIDPGEARFKRMSPIRRQLLGEDADPHSHWGLVNEPVPLRAELDRRELLDPSTPSHR